MTDRELLELAAKAYGDPSIRVDGNGFCRVIGYDDRMGCNVMSGWNPLTDDGDALRLAVKLEIAILLTMEGCSARNAGYTAWCNERATTDPYAATRRAIVRAAAAIGKEMKP